VGPITPAEVERLMSLREAVRRLEPELPDDAPVMTVDDQGETVTAMNNAAGRCVFLTRERLCAIHKHFGSEAKPLQCRLFPLRVVETEDGFRVGISSRCAMAHRSFESASPRSAEEAVAELGLGAPPGELVGLDPRNPRSLRATPIFRANLAQEEYFLSLLSAPQVTMGGLLASGDGTPRLDRRPPAAYLYEAARRLRAWATSWVPDPLNLESSAYGQSVRAFVADLGRLPETPPDWQEPPASVSRYFLHSLRQHLYLRETALMGEVEQGVQVVLLGMLGVLWATRPLMSEDGVADLVGNRLAHWLRLHTRLESPKALFADGPDYRRFRSLLAG
jgi:Fe-S-cluster containining protein